MSNDHDSSNFAKYKRMLERRRLLYAAFLPVGLGLMLSVSVLFPESGMLRWPVLVLYLTGFVVLLRVNDRCPWCNKSFSSEETGKSGSAGFDALFRKQCANCGEPLKLD